MAKDSIRNLTYLHVTDEVCFLFDNTDLHISRLRACLHGGGGPQVAEVTCLAGVTGLSI